MVKGVDRLDGRSPAGPDVSVVIVSWRVREHLARCLAALPAAAGGLSYEVIVVDNASGDGSVEMVRARFPDVRLVANDVNLLYTAAANQGLALARGRYALLLNPDAILHPGGMARLVRCAEAHPEAGLLGPRIFDAAGRDDWRTGRRYPTPWSEFVDWSGVGRWFSFVPFLVKNRQLAYDRGRTSAVPLLSGACLLFSPQLPASLRQLDPNYPMYGEDIDLCRRVDRAGFQKILVGDALMTHIGGASSSQQPVESALWAVVAMNRYFRQWDGRSAARRHRALMSLVGLMKSAIFCLGGLFISRWRRSCLLYCRLLRWSILGGQ